MKLIDIIKFIDSDFEENQTKLMKVFGDPGHDIGDAANALEIMSNLLTEGHYNKSNPDLPFLYDAFKYAIPSLTGEQLDSAFDELSKMTSEQWQALYKELYPNEPPYSGFGPAW